MAVRLQTFAQLPWVGGLNTSLDESMVPPNQLTVADNVIFAERGSKKKREGYNYDYDDISAGSVNVIGLHDFWFGATTRTQRLIRVGSDRSIKSDNAGTTTALTDAGTAWAGTLTKCSMLTFNNLCLIAVDGSNNVVKKYAGSGDVEDLDGTPPQASLLREHLGRVWTNDKTRPDRLHYSETSDHTKWNGLGDSGAIDIGIGDGDPEGITGFASFKGVLFVWKRTKLYKVVGEYPETFQVVLVSNGVGCVAHNSIASIDTEDLVWVSDKGVHSLQATDAYGDFSSAYVSVDIQRTFNDDISRSRLPYVWAGYLPSINSVAFTFTEESPLNRSLTTTTVNNTLYLYNFSLKAWSRWPDLPCQSLIVANDADKRRFYLGTHTSRVIKTFNGTNYDISSAGSNAAIRLRVKTGIIFVDGSPFNWKGLKNFTLYYTPRGQHVITAAIRLDNKRLSNENSLSFSESTGATPLGTGFILGSTPLGSSVILGAYTRMVDGYGKGIQLEITQADVGSDVEIQGFSLSYEVSGPMQEVQAS